jgi:hypothetical protein
LVSLLSEADAAGNVWEEEEEEEGVFVVINKLSIQDEEEKEKREVLLHADNTQVIKSDGL